MAFTVTRLLRLLITHAPYESYYSEYLGAVNVIMNLKLGKASGTKLFRL